MHDNFSEISERVLQLARNEARSSGRKAVGTEHLLLGLLEERRSLAHKLLEHFGVSPERVRGLIENIYPRSECENSDNLEYTPRSRSILNLSAEHAQKRSSATIEPEHILLALIQEDAGLASRVLERLQIDTNKIESCIPGGSTSISFASREDFKKALAITNIVRSDVLLKNRGIIGKTKDEIREKLGEPDAIGHNLIEYRCATAGERHGTTRLIIILDKEIAVQYSLLKESSG